MTTKNGSYLGTAIPNKVLVSFQSFFGVLHEIKEEKKKNKTSKILKFSTISLAAPKPKANVCFGRVVLQGWWELRLFWFTSATGLTQGLWCCPLRVEFGRLRRWRTPLATPCCAAKCPRVEIGAGGSEHWLKPRKCAIRLFTTRLSLTEGNRQPFFLQ